MITMRRKCLESWIVIVLGLAVVLGAALRLHRLDALSIWYDEGWTLYLTHSGPLETLRLAARHADPHPPGYYLVLIPWLRMLGHGAGAARAFSVAAGVLTIPAMYYAGRHLFDRETGLVAAMLVAVAPAHIAYSQEARMYALLGLLTVVLLELCHRYAYRRHRWGWPHWVALIVTQSLALYTHFIAFFLVLGLQAWVVVALASEARDGARRPLRNWIGGQLLVAVTLAPWMPVMVRTARGHVTASTYTPPLLLYVMDVWSFLLAGQIDLLGPHPLYAALAMLALGLVVAGLLRTLWRDTKAREMGYLAASILITMAGVYLLMLVRPGFHPRYLFMILLPLLLVVARLVADLAQRRTWIGRAGALGILLVWLGASLLGGRLAAATNPWRDDARSTAAYLMEQLQPGSVVVAAYTGWELAYYLQASDLSIRFYGPEAFRRGITDELSALVHQTPQAAYVRWRQSDTDHTGQIAYTLAREGRLLSERQFPAYDVTLYTTSSDSPLVRECPVDVRFGALALIGAELGEQVPLDGVLTVALHWRLESPVADDLKVSLTLLDLRGRMLVQHDDFLRDVRGAGTSRWTPYQAGVTYHGLMLPAGLAPLTYSVQGAVYHEADLTALEVWDADGAPLGRAATLCTVELAPAAYADEPRPVDRAARGLVPLPGAGQDAPGLWLAAYRLERDEVATGERLSVLLEWQNRSGQGLPDLLPALELVRDGRVLASEQGAPVDGAYPTDRWAPGQIVLEWRELVVPLDTVPGRAQVVVRVPGDAPVILDEVEIHAVPRRYERPRVQQRLDETLGDQATLIGYDLPATVIAAGSDLTVTLHWEALATSEKPLVVFVHLVSEDGRLIAQHDGVPVQGSRPTTGWVRGEFITDEHSLHWLDPEYGGMALIHVGLYDPATGERLDAVSGESSLVLPDAIIVP